MDLDQHLFTMQLRDQKQIPPKTIQQIKIQMISAIFDWFDKQSEYWDKKQRDAAALLAKKIIDEISSSY